MRVIPGSFGDMLHEVKASESNPPLYYVLAWGWAKAFGTGEFGLRSLSALFGAATVPVAYLIGRQLASRRAGLILAALVAVNPMLIWYSQEARSYALLVFFGALSLLFFVRALDTRRGRDLALWALASALALCSHYFAVFAVGIEAVWLLVALRSRWRARPAGVGRRRRGRAGAAAADQRPGQPDPHRLDRKQPARPPRLWETGRQLPDRRNRPRDRRGAARALRAGPGDPDRRRADPARPSRQPPRAARRRHRACRSGSAWRRWPAAAALVGKDYVVERNLLPALVPLLAVAAIGFATDGARRLGLLLAVALCAYWLAFDDPRHPDAEPAAARLPHRHRRARPAAVGAAGDRHLEARRPTRSATT